MKVFALMRAFPSYQDKLTLLKPLLTPILTHFHRYWQEKSRTYSCLAQLVYYLCSIPACPPPVDKVKIHFKTNFSVPKNLKKSNHLYI